ncbi:MAG: TonB-dependent receptor [Flavobacteriales bacterium]|nr:TonB-dependent receptor [Flavobacteriales bacterium]
MRTKITTVLSFLLVLFGFSAFSQEIAISGTVASGEDGLPLPGVSIIVVGTSTGTSTDFDGNYSITANVGQKLQFNFIGFTDQLVTVSSQPRVDVILEVDAKALDEIVVTGYSSKKVSELTGSLVTVKSDKLGSVPLVSVDQMLNGNVAGLQSFSSSGQPGAKQEIRIRGISSILAGNDPLYVLDGVPIVTGDLTGLTTSSDVLASINANDIESVTVLKDASATSQYGARGANGVIVINTKRGKIGATKFSFSAEYGSNDLAVSGQDPMNAQEMTHYVGTSAMNSYGLSREEADEFIKANYWDGETDTDWKKEVQRSQATQQVYNFSASGGDKRTQFRVSGGYFDQQGVIDATGYKRISGALNVTSQATKRLKIQVGVTGSYGKQESVSQGGSFSNPMLAQYFLRSWDKAYNEDGSLYIGQPGSRRMPNGLFNPMFLQENNFQNAGTMKVNLNAQATYEIMEGLDVSSRLGLDYYGIEEKMYWDPRHGDGFSYGGSVDDNYTRNYNWVWQNMINYSKIIDEHTFRVGLVYEAIQNKNYVMYLRGENMPTYGLYNAATTAKKADLSSSGQNWTSQSSMITASYSFGGKLNIDGTFRREGNSRFSEKNKYGNFWSVGASYDLVQDVLSGVDMFDLMKLRTSYGVTGNAAIGHNKFMDQVGYSGAYLEQNIIYPSNLGNPDLTWEVNKPLNIGLDFAMFDNRLSGTIEYYTRTTEDLLLDVPLSRTTGFAVQTQNVGSMVNQGWEFQLNTVNVEAGDFRWTTSFNIATLKNEITEMVKDKDGEFQETIRNGKQLKVGNNVSSWYQREWAGVNTTNGDPLWYRTDGELTNDYSSVERQVLGQSIPSLTGGMTNTLTFKGIEFSFQLNYAGGYQVYDDWAYYQMSDGAFNRNYNGYATLLDYWEKPGDVSANPKPMWLGNKNSNSGSSRFMYDGDHIRLRNIQLGYNLPQSWSKKAGLSNVNLYVRGVNLMTWAFDEDLKWDPEVDTSGYVDLRVPPLKTLTFGVKLGF